MKSVEHKRVSDVKEKKKQEIIESTIKLSAKNGFYNTSIQGIADDCGISKGAFYHYFNSKEALHIAIFQYYFDQMKEMLASIDKENLPPREIMRRQLRVPFKQLSKQREFFIIYLREQNFSINKELQDVMRQSQLDMVRWYEKNLKRIYGSGITPYISDIILMIEGMRNGYLATILFHDLQLDADQITCFLMNRLDDVVQAFHQGEKPVITSSEIAHLLPKHAYSPLQKQKQALGLLTDMEEKLEFMQLEQSQKEGLLEVIHFLKDELDKSEWNTFAFQGMLANLKTIKSFDTHRKKIANLMKVDLL